jgi:hypothetical protein
MWRRLSAALLAAPLLVTAGQVAAAAERGEENEVKAAVIYNLLLFVQWPAQQAPAGNLKLCVLEEGALTKALRQHENKVVQGHSLQILRVGSAPTELDACAAVMVDTGSPEMLARLRLVARNRALLIMAEGPGALDRGAMIGIYGDGGRIGFDINLRAMKSSGLGASSKILRLARTLIE